MPPRRLAAALLLALATAHAHAATVSAPKADAKAEPKADPAVAARLDEIGYTYEVDEDGDYRLVIAMDDDKRSQLVYVRSTVESYGAHRVREIWSPAWRAAGDAFPGPIANRLLEASNDLKLGAWVKHGSHAVLVVKLDADASAEGLENALAAALTSADEMQKELDGDAASDEF